MSQPSNFIMARQEKQTQKRAQRLANYKQVHALRAQGYRVSDIAYHLSMGKRTVYTYLSYPTFPEWQPTVHRRHRKSKLDNYKPYLEAQWQQGRTVTKELFKEIQQQGYSGTYKSVACYTRKLRQQKREALNELPGRGPSKVNAADQKPLSASRAAWLIMRREETLTTEEKATIERLSQHPKLATPITLTQGFLSLVRERLPQNLDNWLEQAKHSAISAFHSFQRG
ncbi:MAG: hypothetical protein WA901_10785 [Phormidesmis sp.]